MAGRITYKHSEIHSDSGWIIPIQLTNRAKLKIEKLIDRDLTGSEIAYISGHLSKIRSIRTDLVEVNSQDIKRTLSSFCKLSPQDALANYKNSDSTIQALIDEALVIDKEVFNNGFIKPSGKDIIDAASIALTNFKSGSGGRKHKGYLYPLAIFTLNLWDHLGMVACKPWQHPDYSPKASPIVLLMEELKILIDGESIDYKDAVIRLRDAQKIGKVEPL